MKASRLLTMATSREAVSLVIRITWGGASFAISMLLARQLGPQSYGMVALILSWLLLLIGVVRIAVVNLLVREVAALYQASAFGKLHGLLRSALVFVVIAALAISLAAIVLSGPAAIAMDGQNRMLLFAGLPVLLFIGLMAAIEAVTRGFGNVVRGQIGEYVVRPVSLLMIAALLVLGPAGLDLTPLSAMGAYSVSALLAAAAAWCLRDKQKLQIVASQPASYEARNWIKSGVAMSAAGVLGMLNIQATPILLGILSTKSDVAHFQIASQLAFLVSLMLAVMNSVQGADISRAFATNDIKQLQLLAIRSCRVSLAFASACALVYLVLGRQMIDLFLGHAYDGLYPVLLVITLGNFINSISGSAGLLMISCRQENEVVKALLYAFVANIVGCVLLIPWLGALGGGISAALQLAVWNTILVVKVRQKTGIWSLPIVSRPA